MEIRLSDAEITVMQLLWKNGDMRASELAEAAKAEKGWEKNTTYTLINRLIKKNAVERIDPDFNCKALVDETMIRKTEAKGLLDKLYSGSFNLFVQSFLKDETITDDEMDELVKIINEKRR
ncbi:MAG: hypothetical protein BGN88_08040 [Clostridiales bacterium 43-6]|nr:MAG: hypothetical protein BGN88_08040 [Clostridiales bacterium 43-6]